MSTLVIGQEVAIADRPPTVGDMRTHLKILFTQGTTPPSPTQRGTSKQTPSMVVKRPRGNPTHRSFVERLCRSFMLKSTAFQEDDRKSRIEKWKGLGKCRSSTRPDDTDIRAQTCIRVKIVGVKKHEDCCAVSILMRNKSQARCTRFHCASKKHQCVNGCHQEQSFMPIPLFGAQPSRHLAIWSRVR